MILLDYNYVVVVVVYSQFMDPPASDRGHYGVVRYNYVIVLAETH
jgi:hypothetical protein